MHTHPMALERGGPYRQRPVRPHAAPRTRGHDVLVIVALMLALASIERWADAINGLSAAMGFPRVH